MVFPFYRSFLPTVESSSTTLEHGTFAYFTFVFAKKFDQKYKPRACLLGHQIQKINTPQLKTC